MSWIDSATTTVLFSIGRFNITPAKLAIAAASVVIALVAVVHAVVARRQLRKPWPLAHLVGGGVGVIGWLLFLALPSKDLSNDASDVLGVIGLAGWWVVGVTGIFLCAAEWPRSVAGSRSSSDRTRTGTVWAAIGHPLALICGVVLTFGYLFNWV